MAQNHLITAFSQPFKIPASEDISEGQIPETIDDEPSSKQSLRVYGHPNTTSSLPAGKTADGHSWLATHAQHRAFTQTELCTAVRLRTRTRSATTLVAWPVRDINGLKLSYALIETVHSSAANHIR